MEWIRMCKVLEDEYRIMEKIFFEKKTKYMIIRLEVQHMNKLKMCQKILVARPPTLTTKPSVTSE